MTQRTPFRPATGILAATSGRRLPHSEVGNRRSHESEQNHLKEAPHDIKVVERTLLSRVVVHVVILSNPVDEIALRTRVEASK